VSDRTLSVYLSLCPSVFPSLSPVSPSHSPRATRSAGRDGDLARVALVGVSVLRRGRSDVAALLANGDAGPLEDVLRVR
jgi:hypothetical protein